MMRRFTAMSQAIEQRGSFPELIERDKPTAGRRRLIRAGFLLLATLLSLFFSGLAHGQQINASVTGVVSDEKQSLIPNASVVIESAQLAVRRTATTNADGYFSITNLPVGLYRITVEVPGFSNFVQENVKVDVGNTLSLTITMNVNQITQQVNVTETVYQTVNKETANIETLIFAVS